VDAPVAAVGDGHRQVAGAAVRHELVALEADGVGGGRRVVAEEGVGQEGLVRLVVPAPVGRVDVRGGVVQRR
jgi:hypothetical protein